MFHFFAYISRLKHINRWNLMRNTRRENVMEHTCETAMIAHCLVTLQNTRHGAGLDAQRAAVLALYHETGEVITGDLATPIKYFSPDISAAYKAVEGIAERRMCAMLPDDVRGEYEGIIRGGTQEPEWPYVKAADRICAYIKCVEELKVGNQEFGKAAASIRRSIEESPIEAVADFMADFMPSYALALDELN